MGTKTFFGNNENTVKTKTGQLKGPAKDSEGKFKMEGVVFQKQGLGAGLLFEKGQAPFGLMLTPND